jgi:hypothetical protein
MDLPADDDPTGARGMSKCNPVTLCCPSSTAPHSDEGCVVLYDMDMAKLHLAQPSELVRITPAVSNRAVSAADVAGSAPAAGARAAANISSLPATTRASFGGLTAITGTFQLDPHGARRRRLQTATGGALFVNRTTYHGSRTTLHVIINALDPGNGDVKTWTLPCRVVNVRKSFFGTDGGSAYATGASPYALRPQCRTGADSTCKFNARDHIRAVSLNRVDLPPVGSRVVTLSAVRNYPPTFCAFYTIINLVRDAVRAQTGVDPDAFKHMIVYVPRHCAIGQGEQPGRNVIVQLCPGGDRDNLYSSVSHELGHNLGLGHGSIYQGSAYGDGSSFMASGGGGRINTLNLAHRHAFRWVPGGPTGLFMNNHASGSVFARVLKLVDFNTITTLPAGAVWGAKIDEADASWYVGYRGCTGYDFTSRTDWCGGVQISRRFGDSTQGFHHAWLRAAGERLSFGANNFITVTLGGVAAPASLESVGLSGGLTITISVSR